MKYTIELPEIEGFEQVLDGEGQPSYDFAVGRCYYRTGENLNVATKWGPEGVMSEVRAFILRKIERKFQFGDVVVATTGVRPRLIVGAGTHGKYQVACEGETRYFRGDQLKLLAESTEETRLETIKLINGEMQ